jgi:hypothetical protein
MKLQSTSILCLGVIQMFIQIQILMLMFLLLRLSRSVLLFHYLLQLSYLYGDNIHGYLDCEFLHMQSYQDYVFQLKLSINQDKPPFQHRS